MTQRLATFLINLDGSDARLARATAALTAAGLTFTRIPAFDGRGKTADDLPLYDAAATQRAFGRKMVGGEVGCFLSHIRAAEAFLASGAAYGLVLEDDATVPPDAAETLRLLLDALETGAAVTPWRVINLGRPASRVLTPLEMVSNSHRLIRAHYHPMTTTAILWNRDGARAFLNGAARRIDMPVDNWIQRWASARDCGLALAPPLFPPAEGDSEIGGAVQRKGGARGWGYFIGKQTRLWRNKLRALRNRGAFRRGLMDNARAVRG